MDEHRHGSEYYHEHEGGDAPHAHMGIVEEPETVEEAVEEHEEEEHHEEEHSEAEHTENVATAALDAITEMHRQEEETERTEVLTEMLSVITETQREVEPEHEDNNEIPAQELEAAELVEPPQEKDDKDDKDEPAQSSAKHGYGFRR